MTPRNTALADLKASIIVLVVAHHAVLAYALPATSHFDRVHFLANAAPVMDELRFAGFQLVVSVNDKFMMPLMFLISGLFVWPSLARKGYGRYLRDRVLRLGLPFVLATTLVMPVAYFPAYLLSGARLEPFGYLGAYFSAQGYPLGPAWFLSMLLALDLALITTTALIPGSQRLLAWLGSVANHRPVNLFLLLVAFSTPPFYCMLLRYGPDSSSWIQYGPLAVQLTRLPLYLVYFLVGVSIGADRSTERGLLGASAVFPRHAWRWMAFGVGCAWLYLGLSTADPSPESQSARPHLLATWALSVVLTGAGLGLASLSLALRYARLRSGTLDSLAQAAFGIYLLHYPCVTWMQYGLRHAALPAPVKGGITFTIALALSWAMTAALRRLPMFARML